MIHRSKKPAQTYILYPFHVGQWLRHCLVDPSPNGRLRKRVVNNSDRWNSLHGHAYHRRHVFCQRFCKNYGKTKKKYNRFHTIVDWHLTCVFLRCIQRIYPHGHLVNVYNFIQYISFMHNGRVQIEQFCIGTALLGTVFLGYDP